MKIKSFVLTRTGGFTFLILQVILLFICTHLIFARGAKIKFKIKETADSISVTARRYSLSIEKSSAVASLTNWHGEAYTSFPLDVQYNLDEIKNKLQANREWNIRDRKISLKIVLDGLIAQEVIISCFDEAFEIRLASMPPHPTNFGAYLLRRDKFGFDTSDWDQYFSPEPDDYFRTTPNVDIRVDRDQQWVFTPAPLNLSFKTPAGWFSIGLAELPDASIYAFKNNAIWLDIPWQKLQVKYNKIFRFPALVFTFNDSPWEAVGDFSLYLNRNNLMTAPVTEQRPNWWKRPLVSTWGEQRVKQISGNHPNFNSNWVKNYVVQQRQALDSLTFNLIIENKWANADGDPTPADRFRDLRNLIDWCHEQGIKVILFWKAWKVEANSLPIRMGIFDGEHVDATHDLFENYVDSCCQMIFGNNPDQLSADGLKIDFLFLTRDPAKASYANTLKGVGIREAYLYLRTFYQMAKKYKSDALIMSSAIDPHFADVQDMVRINDDWDHKTIREKRARIITQAMPGLLINGGAVDMSINIALYHYVTSAIYGVPAIHYLNHFHDAVIPQETKEQILKLLKLYMCKPDGRLQFIDYGNWQILNKDNEVVAESIPSGKGFLFLEDKDKASLLCTENSDLHIIFDRHLLKTIHDENGIKIPFTDLGHGLYELNDAKEGIIYKLQLSKISIKRH